MQRYFYILVLFTVFFANAQKGWMLEFNLPENTSAQARSILTPRPLTDSAEGWHELHQTLLQLNESGYLAARFTGVQWLDQRVMVGVEPGPLYRWVKLNMQSIPKDMLSASGVGEADTKDQVYNPSAYAALANRLLNVLEEGGYPFAQLTLEEIELRDSGISATWSLNRNTLMRFDSAYVRGNPGVKSWYIEKYLGIEPDGLYRESRVKAIAGKLRQLQFVSLTREPAIYFHGNRAMPVIDLAKRKASSFDGIVGFAPNATNNRMLITGEANISLQNLFETGKTFDLNYRSFLGNSQDLRLKFFYPYILRTAIGIDYGLQVLRQDSSFLDVKQELGFQYRFTGNEYLRFFYQYQSTSLITVDTLAIITTRTLPQAADLQYTAYGLSVRISRFDYLFNPRKGYGIDLSAGVGLKKLQRNPLIEGLDIRDGTGSPVDVYASVPSSMVQTKASGSTDVFIPFLKQSAFRIQAMSGYLHARSLYLNELFRIGGIRTLKGFDEQSIFASSYVILNAEYRYLFQRNAHFTVFWNGAWYERLVGGQTISDRPFGAGAGLNFETGPGVFSLYYAVGKAFNNPVSFSQAKIHFGFVSYF